MKDPRTWNRREFSVTPNGLFTILRPTGWFSTLRLPGGFRYRVGLSEESEFPWAYEDPTAVTPPESTFMPRQKALGHADSQQTAILSQTMQMSTHDNHLLRTTLIILAAAAITLTMLWWLLSFIPGFSI